MKNTQTTKKTAATTATEQLPIKYISKEKLDKIAALAERGVDGERDNAVRILSRHMKESTVTVHSRTVTSRDKPSEWEQHTMPRTNRPHYILLPYIHFVLPNHKPNADYEHTDEQARIWRSVGEMARKIIEKATGTITVQDWVDKITCVCSVTDFLDIQRLVADAIYEMLCDLNIPVIHMGGDKAGFAPDTDCMEDGTENGIFQFETCRQFQAPNMDAEIRSAMAIPRYNCFVAYTGTQKCWGKVTDYNTEAGTITLTPANTKHPAVTFKLAELQRIYRAEKFMRNCFQCVPEEQAGELAAAKERAKNIYGK